MNRETPGLIHINDVLHHVDAASLQHVLWLGGSPCSGKSSVTDILAQWYPVQAYHVDDAFQKHSSDFTPNLYPTNYKWTHTSWQDLWMQSQTALLEQAIACYTEHLRFILSDLAEMEGVVIAEGTSLLPDCIKLLLEDVTHALWMVPTQDFQRKVYPMRGHFVAHILQNCEEPEQAFKNWMDRDVAFARWIQTRTRHHNLRCIQVDGQRSIEENAIRIGEHFQLASMK